MQKNGVSLSFHDVGYNVKIKRRCTEEWKKIIKNISGIFKPGMNAILGPTGCGKTTFLDVLAGKKDPNRVEGSVLMNGYPQLKNYKCMSAYVNQENLLMGTMTVRECIMFSANLRIPNKILVNKTCKVDDILRELGLMKCADTMIGNEFLRGVSGGELKRTAIGMELITSPSIIFLDEPTTGLDANTATSVMQLLHDLSKKGNTIIFSIHQPRYAIYKMFDNILILGDGRTIYHGPTENTLQYFERFGFVCEEHNNPPDFFLDIINLEPIEIIHKKDAECNNNKEINERDEDDIKNFPSSTLHEKFISSLEYASITIELDYLIQKYQNQILPNSDDNNEGYANGFYTQMKYLSKRSVTNFVRNPQALVMQFSIVCVYAFIIGILFFQIGNGLESGLQNRIGVIFFIVMNQLHVNVSSIDLFIKERKIFMYESTSGYYKVSSYFLIKLFCDIIPMRIIPVTLFSFFSYLLIGFQVEVDKFFIYYLCILLTTLAGSSVGFLMSTCVNIVIVANALTTIIFLLMMFFGGFLVNLKTMPEWLNWLQYFSITRYSINVLCINELYDLTLYTYINATEVGYPDIGKNYLDTQGIKYETLWEFWQNILAIFLIMIVLMLVSYIQLRRLPKYK